MSIHNVKEKDDVLQSPNNEIVHDMKNDDDVQITNNVIDSNMKLDDDDDEIDDEIDDENSSISSGNTNNDYSISDSERSASDSDDDDLSSCSSSHYSNCSLEESDDDTIINFATIAGVLLVAFSYVACAQQQATGAKNDLEYETMKTKMFSNHLGKKRLNLKRISDSENDSDTVSSRCPSYDNSSTCISTLTNYDDNENNNNNSIDLESITKTNVLASSSDEACAHKQAAQQQMMTKNTEKRKSISFSSPHRGKRSKQKLEL